MKARLITWALGFALLALAAPASAQIQRTRCDPAASEPYTCAAPTLGRCWTNSSTGAVQFCQGAGPSWVTVGALAATATVLAANGANCSAGSYPLGVDAAGAVEDCTVAGGGGANTTLSNLASVAINAPLATGAGTAAALTATPSTATTGASQAGVGASLTASAATASTDTAGAAAGGSVTITGGAAARNTSGNAAGGDVILVGGAGTGTGTAGHVVIPVGTAAAPGISFSGDPNTGFYWSSSDTFNVTTAGVQRMVFGSSGTMTIVGALAGNTGQSAFFGFASTVTPKTSDATESGNQSYAYLNNTGATGLITRTLPTAVAGWVFTYVVTDADGFKIVAASGDDIRVIDKITATAGYIQSTTIGSTVTLVAMDATTWYATAINGAWSDGTFTYDNTSLTTP